MRDLFDTDDLSQPRQVQAIVRRQRARRDTAFDTEAEAGKLAAVLPRVRLTLLVGGIAQSTYLKAGIGLGGRLRDSMTETVRDFRRYLPQHLPLPHPSWRNTGWIRANPWFQSDLLPALRAAVAAALA